MDWFIIRAVQLIEQDSICASILAYPLSFLIVFCYLFQNFLFTTKEENSPLKAIDFGLSDYVKLG